MVNPTRVKVLDLLCFSFILTTHVQTNHTVTSAVTRVRAPMKEHALSYATTPNKGSNAHVPRGIPADSVRSVGRHLKESLLERTCGAIHACTFCLIQQLTLCTKSFAILHLQMGLFGLLSIRSAFPTRTSKDYPANQEAFTWNRFRLSWSRMDAIAKHSKHVEPHATLTLMDLNSVIT